MYSCGMTRRAVPSARREVNRALADMGEPKLSDAEWVYWRIDWAEDDGQMRSGFDVEWCAEKAVDGRRKLVVVEPEAGAQQQHGRWVLAKSLLLVAEAESDRQVVEFRSRHLPDGLVTLNQVEQWVVSRHEPGEVVISLWAPTGWAPDVNAMEADRPVSLTGRFRGTIRNDLAFPAAAGHVSRVGVGRTGPLAELAGVVRHLVGRYRSWQPAQATAFVVAGAVPIVSVLRQGDEPLLPITLQIDPDVGVDEVAAVYASLRREILGQKPRRVSERGAELVIHWAQHPGVSDHALRVTWNEANQANPKAQFASIRAFRQALRDARRRLASGPRPARD